MESKKYGAACVGRCQSAMVGQAHYQLYVAECMLKQSLMHLTRQR